MWWLALAACEGSGPGPKDEPAPEETAHSGSAPVPHGWCEVRDVFTAHCVRCHAPGGLEPSLDLQTDPFAAVVGVNGALSSLPLVVPGDPAASHLLLKMEDRQAAGQGTVMPPTGSLSGPSEVVRGWVASGAQGETCEPAHSGTTPGTVHVAGWDAPGSHGASAKYQTTQDCRDCHGADLGGGSSGVSCDGCHAAGWRSDCTYCHGGVVSGSGAPPEDLDDNPDEATSTFPDHSAHESGRIAAPVDCAGCHPVWTAAADPGHWLDDSTAGEAEITLVGGSYLGRTCSDVACHADGRDATRGDVQSGTGPLGCTGCHPGAMSSVAALDAMSGSHTEHLSVGATCGECHADADGNGAIDDPSAHVDGAVQFALPVGMTTSGGTCSGDCHGHGHASAGW